MAVVPQRESLRRRVLGPDPGRRIQSHAERKSVLVSCSLGGRSGAIRQHRRARAMLRATQGGLFPS